MNKRNFDSTMLDKLLFRTALVAACGAAAFAIPALAQQATGTSTASQAAPAGHASANAKATKAQRAVPPVDSRMCVRSTGSHLHPAKGQCLPVAGSSYSQQDIRRTGAANLGQALQMLDPSVTVHGH